MTPYLGEIRMFAFGFVPHGWQMCAGQLLRIDQFQNLFQVIGTTYGGDGVTNFALPDFRGRLPVHPSKDIPLGEKAGTETSTLYLSTMPPHSHVVKAAPIKASSGPGTSSSPSGAFPAHSGADASYSAKSGANDFAAADAVHARAAAFGSNVPFSNMMPALSINFCIAYEGFL